MKGYVVLWVIEKKSAAFNLMIASGSAHFGSARAAQTAQDWLKRQGADVTIIPDDGMPQAILS